MRDDQLVLIKSIFNALGSKVDPNFQQSFSNKLHQYFQHSNNSAVLVQEFNQSGCFVQSVLVDVVYREFYKIQRAVIRHGKQVVKTYNQLIQNGFSISGVRPLALENHYAKDLAARCEGMQDKINKILNWGQPVSGEVFVGWLDACDYYLRVLLGQKDRLRIQNGHLSRCTSPASSDSSGTSSDSSVGEVTQGELIVRMRLQSMLSNIPVNTVSLFSNKNSNNFSQQDEKKETANLPKFGGHSEERQSAQQHFFSPHLVKPQGIQGEWDVEAQRYMQVQKMG
jgi:hypothetical protein